MTANQADIIKELLLTVMGLRARIKEMERVGKMTQIAQKRMQPARPMSSATIKIIEVLLRDAWHRFFLTPSELRGPNKCARYARARQWVMFEAHDAGCSDTKIGRELGWRDHSTICKGRKAEAARRAAEANGAMPVFKSIRGGSIGVLA